MLTIQTYTNTKCELEMAKTRLNLLMDRKEKLYCKYFPITSKPKEISVMGGDHNNDKMADYLHELHTVDVGTGTSLAEEIINQQENVNVLQGYINTMESTLAKMSGIEYDLYYEIVVNGTQISRAIDKVAEKHGLDNQTIWKNYYRKIKKDVKTVIRYSESTVTNVLKYKM